jgi:hypothetical protein
MVAIARTTARSLKTAVSSNDPPDFPAGYAGKSISDGDNSPIVRSFGVHFFIKFAGDPADR